MLLLPSYIWIEAIRKAAQRVSFRHLLFLYITVRTETNLDIDNPSELDRVCRLKPQRLRLGRLLSAAASATKTNLLYLVRLRNLDNVIYPLVGHTP